MLVSAIKPILKFYPRLYIRLMSRTYKDAIEKLNSQQTNAATLDAIRASGGRLNDLAIPEMLEYLDRIGHTPEELNRLNIIHVTGTKGKGSTCAFCDSILRHTLPADKKIGLYTSPHIIAVRERIRVNGIPLSEEDFAKFFFEVWDLLEKNDNRIHPSTPPKPMYFRLVTLVAFHAFISLKVDATILEVGVGGLHDSTNIVPCPIVTGVSSLGLDHVSVLGHTVSEIAYNKAGIFKKGVPAFSVEQPEEGMETLKRRAIELEASEFTVVPTYPELASIKLGIAGVHQRQNASLAICLAHKFLQKTGLIQADVPLQPFNGAIINGVEIARWPGRCQEVQDPKAAGTTWFLDGSHTTESLACGMKWFVSVGIGNEIDSLSERVSRVLIFNCTSGRSGRDFLETIVNVIESGLHGENTKKTFFDHVIFCTNVTYVNGGFKPDFTSKAIHSDELSKLTTQSDLASTWKNLFPNFVESNVHVLPSVQHAVRVVRSLETRGKPVNILVCGSLHLVGGVIEVADLAEVAMRT